jgi:glycerophosphoryl diester phosphodiesterase
VLNDKLLRTAKSIGLGVIAWTINEPPDIERLLDFGVDGMMSDHPDRVLDVFSRRGLTTLGLSDPA